VIRSERTTIAKSNEPYLFDFSKARLTTKIPKPKYKSFTVGSQELFSANQKRWLYSNQSRLDSELKPLAEYTANRFA
jgi:hypothetical protein